MMPTIPLYHSSPAANVSHGVNSPGGYERWHFHAVDVYRDLRIEATFYHGYPFHPEYLKRYAAYLRRPTRVRPPLPGEYPVVHFAVYQGNELLGEFLTQYPPTAFSASVGAPAISIGPNRWLAGSNIQLTLSGITSKRGGAWAEIHAGRPLKGNFVFAPTGPHNPAEELTYLSPEISGHSTHRWLLNNPLCKVHGSIRCAGESLDFSGLGYHDQVYGTAPPGFGPRGIGLSRAFTGRILFENAAYAFHHSRPRNPELEDEIHLLEAGPAGIRRIPIAHADIKWSGFNRWGMRHPKQVVFEDALTLIDPRVIASSPMHLRLTYAAQLPNRAAKADCDFIAPRRTHYPIIQKIIQHDIHRA